VCCGEAELLDLPPSVIEVRAGVEYRSRLLSCGLRLTAIAGR